MNDQSKMGAGGKLCSHFGYCEQFAISETEGDKIKGKALQTPQPHEPGALPRWLHGLKAKMIIPGGMGSRAQNLFTESRIKVITGVPMDPPESLANQYIADMLTTRENACNH